MAGHPELHVSESICPEVDRFHVDRGARDFSPKSGCLEIRISGTRRQSVARANNFEEFGAGWLSGEGRWPKTGSGTRRCWRPRRRRGLWAIWSPVWRHPAYFGSLVYQRTSRFRRHLPGAKAGRGRSSGGDLPADWPILGRPAELRSAGYLKNLGIRTSRRRVYGLSELRFSTSLSAASESEIPGLCELAGAELSWAICSHGGKFRFDRQIPDSSGIRKS